MAPNRSKLLRAVCGVHAAGILHLGNYIGAVNQCGQT
jgi:tryptophanyl-tRNA synthetase